jgi:hypothetical protein
MIRQNHAWFWRNIAFRGVACKHIHASGVRCFLQYARQHDAGRHDARRRHNAGAITAPDVASTTTSLGGPKIKPIEAVVSGAGSDKSNL